jgi:tRNA(Ile)-lysidine synthase
MDLVDQVRHTIDEHDLLAPGDRVVVGVSGGPDSLCLLHVLTRLQAAYDLALHVAHLHHGRRGADADADARFVRDVAGRWHLPCTVARADVPALARAHHLAFEEAARRARYAFLARVAAEVGAQTVAVGHNAGDQAETVLMHFIRGSGLAGLRGMLPRTPLAGYRLLEPAPPLPPLDLVRPLLDTGRAEIRAYCQAHGLEPRFDRSNLDTTYFRNWLRHEVLPLLEQHNPNVQAVLCRTAAVVADDYRLLRSLLEETWPDVVLNEEGERLTFDRAAWRGLPTGLQRATLREAIHRLRRSLRNINFVHVENALRVARDGTTGDRATLPGGLMLTLGYERFAVAAAGDAGPLPGWPLLDPGAVPLPLRVPGVTALPGSDWLLAAELTDRVALPAGWQDNADPWRAYLDAAAVGPAPVLRTRRPGDRFQPLGMGGHGVKLADFYTNQKVPRAARDRLPLLEGAHGIAWVCGWRVDERARVREATAQALTLRFYLP